MIIELGHPDDIVPQEEEPYTIVNWDFFRRNTDSEIGSIPRIETKPAIEEEIENFEENIRRTGDQCARLRFPNQETTNTRKYQTTQNTSSEE